MVSRIALLLAFLCSFVSAQTTRPYVGHEPNAPWRAKAQKRIDQIRKADLTITVVDANNRPVPNAKVKIDMTRQGFPFGTCINEFAIVNEPKYREILEKYFNIAVVENGLKWPTWEHTPHDTIDKAIAWLHENKIAIRGHNLVWPSWQPNGGTLPAETVPLQKNPPALAARILDHITKEAGYYAGQFSDWDVINEPYAHHEVIDILGRHAMVDWFNAARAADPHAMLYLNDYLMFHTTKEQFFYDNIKYLVDNHAPIQAIGEQAHISGKLPSPEHVLASLNKFSKFGLPIRITEFDVSVDDEQLQADYLRDFYTAAFSHPNVNGILMWGFHDGHHWRPKAALWRNDYSLKPAGKVFVDLITKKWATHETVTTDSQGQVKLRAFLGDYTITTDDGKSVYKTTLEKSGHSLTIHSWH